MNTSRTLPAKTENARSKLLDAAIALVRQQGFSATTVDQLCGMAGVTKGAFFHHFASKDALGAAAAEHWTATSSALFMEADFNRHDDPLDRSLGYLDFRDAAYQSIAGHSDRLAEDLDQSIAKYGAPEGVTGLSLGLYTQAVLQGAFILAKGQGNAEPVHDAIAHLRRYILMLFGRTDRM